MFETMPNDFDCEIETGATTRLDVSNNSITELVNLPSDLKWLDCSKNRLRKTPVMPQCPLEYLNISFNRRIRIQLLPDSINTMICVCCELTSLPAELPRSLEYLDVSNNMLAVIENLPENLLEFHCSDSYVDHIRAFPPRLKIANLNYNNLKVLPALPDSLVVLSVFGWHNKISAINSALPRGLRILRLSMCPTLDLSLDPPRDSIVALDIRGARILDLEPLPRGLKSLKLTSTGDNCIQRIPESLVTLQLYECQQLSLPDIAHAPKLTDVLVNFMHTYICIKNYTEVRNRFLMVLRIVKGLTECGIPSDLTRMLLEDFVRPMNSSLVPRLND